MPIPDFTTVCGVDEKHLKQLELVWPTWKKHKSETLLKNPMLIFFDRDELTAGQVKRAIDHPDMIAVQWPPEEGIVYEGDPSNKFFDPKRYRMLAGFSYVAGTMATTPYWLKLDTDVVATGCQDWIDPEWFQDDPAIISHAWSFTKPPDQMMVLDKWVESRPITLAGLNVYDSLNLVPQPESDRLSHKRIISWCAFFSTSFTRSCNYWAAGSCGKYKLPVPSQDGFLWYCARRTEKKIIRTSMKKRGWAQWLTMKNIRKSVEEAMNE